MVEREEEEEEVSDERTRRQHGVGDEEAPLDGGGQGARAVAQREGRLLPDVAALPEVHQGAVREHEGGGARPPAR